MDYKKEYTDVEKADALRSLVKEAIGEQTEHRSNNFRVAYGGVAFDNRAFQEHHLMSLLKALETTDALLILGKILKVEEI